MRRTALLLALTSTILLSASRFGAKDDRVFRLDRVDNAECAELLPKPKQTASVPRK
jgi:hypothetical protein